MNCVHRMSVLTDMRKILLMLVTITGGSLLYAETVYKSIDINGNVIFSDKPSANAEKIEIKEAQSINMPRITLPDYEPPEKNEKQVHYTSLLITRPEHDSTINDDTGTINVDLVIDPALRDTDLFALYLDDQRVSTGASPSFTLSNVDRGTHNLKVVVIDKADKVLKESDAVVVHLRRTSILSPGKNTESEISPLKPPRPEQADSSPLKPPVPGEPTVAPPVTSR